MKFRKLRIAWSVACGLLCLFLIAAWVRSYWWVDRINLPVNGIAVISIWSMPGEWVFGLSRPPAVKPAYWATISEDEWRRLPRVDRPIFVFRNAWIKAPYWFAVGISAAAAVAPWFRWRYSLRTLLVAMTLVALGVCLAVYLLGK
jgi:hypothetical protein